MSHPKPDARFAKKTLPKVACPGPWFRIHRSNNGAVFFGTTGLHRFDAPNKEYGVLYAAAESHGAFIETFGHATGAHPVTEAEIDDRRLSTLKTTRSLQLVDLAGEGLAKIGADASLTSGNIGDSLVHEWSKAIYDHPQTPDGILYRARHDPSTLAAAIFERAASAIATDSTHSLLDPPHVSLLASILERYDFALI